MFDTDRAFVNTNVNEKVFILNRSILNILSSISKKIFQKNKKFIQEKSNVYKSYRNSKNNNIQYLRRLKLLQEDLHNEIEVSKSNHYS